MNNMRSFVDIGIFFDKLRSITSSAPYTLDRMRDLMAFLDNPQNKIKIIHVAGTSGKTSTSYYIASLLKQAGYSTGLSISPHVDEINERLQINLTPLNETDYIKAFNKFIELINTFDEKITYYEFLIAMAFWYFNKQNVDYAVIEVGIGGLLDGTNVVNNLNKICVITDIGIDHTKLLGSTISQITMQKAGIITKNSKVFCYKQSNEINSIIQKIAKLNNASVYHPKEYKYDLSLNDFQKRNFLLAYSLVSNILAENDKDELNKLQLKKAASIIIPGRFEVIKKDKKTIVFDGAHNLQKIRSLVNDIRKRYSGKSIRVLLTLDSDDLLKNNEIILLINQLSNNLIITTLLDMDNNQLKDKFYSSNKSTTKIKILFIADPLSALDELLKSDDELLLITGSFYLLRKYRYLLIK
ncbi:MAG: Mur ligase family protein [bacterium]